MKHGWKKKYCMSLLVVGEPRVGKSHVVDKFVSERNVDDVPGQQTVVAFEVPEAARLGTFLTDFLRALDDPYPESGDSDAKSQRIWRALERRRTRAVILDETHRLVDERRQSPKKDIVDWVVRSLNRRACPIAFFGTEEMLPLFEGKLAMEGRTLGQVDLLPYVWSDKADRDEFRGVLVRMENALGMPEPRGLSEIRNAWRIWTASRGLLGMTSRLLDTATVVAARDGRPCLTDDILAEALDELRIGADRREPNPFRLKLQPPKAKGAAAAEAEARA